LPLHFQGQSCLKGNYLWGKGIFLAITTALTFCTTLFLNKPTWLEVFFVSYQPKYSLFLCSTSKQSNWLCYCYSHADWFLKKMSCSIEPSHTWMTTISWNIFKSKNFILSCQSFMTIFVQKMIICKFLFNKSLCFNTRWAHFKTFQIFCPKTVFQEHD